MKEVSDLEYDILIDGLANAMNTMTFIGFCLGVVVTITVGYAIWGGFQILGLIRTSKKLKKLNVELDNGAFKEEIYQVVRERKLND